MLFTTSSKIYMSSWELYSALGNTVDWEIFVVKNISSVAYKDENRHTKNFQCRSDKVRIALLGYTKSVHGFPDHHRLFFFSHVTNSIWVRLAPCVAYTYLWLSHFGAFNFRRWKFYRSKFLQTKISRSKVLLRGSPYISTVHSCN